MKEYLFHGVCSSNKYVITCLISYLVQKISIQINLDYITPNHFSSSKYYSNKKVNGWIAKKKMKQIYT